MILYKKDFDESRSIYFLIKEENVFIKYVKILEKVRNIVKANLIVSLYIVKKYLKAEKTNKQTQKEAYDVDIHK